MLFADSRPGNDGLSDAALATLWLGGGALVVAGIIVTCLLLTRQPPVERRAPRGDGPRMRRHVGALRLVVGVPIIVIGGLATLLGVVLKDTVFLEPIPYEHVRPMGWTRPVRQVADNTASMPIVSLPRYLNAGTLTAEVTKVDCGKTVIKGKAVPRAHRVDVYRARGRFCLVHLAFQAEPDPNKVESSAPFPLNLQVAVTGSGEKLGVFRVDERFRYGATNVVNLKRGHDYTNGVVHVDVGGDKVQHAVVPYDVPRGQTIEKMVLRSSLFARPVKVRVAG